MWDVEETEGHEKKKNIYIMDVRMIQQKRKKKRKKKERERERGRDRTGNEKG